MIFSRRLALAAIAALAIATPVRAAVMTGKPAPAFTLSDQDGVQRSLADFAGKTVVLEWTNHDCPYVKKHYGAGAMQALQKAATADGVVWLTIVSSAPGKQGHVTGAQAKSLTRDRSAAPTAVLLDPTGEVGKLYGAKTTPHMYVINGSGALVYQGGIDDKATADPADLAGAQNYVAAALADLKAGRPVAVPAAKPYGCSIKYAD